MIRRTGITVVASLALAAGPAAAAQRAVAAPESASGEGSRLLSVWLDLAPGPVTGIGFGASGMVPLSNSGILRGSSIRDEFALEFGGDLVQYGGRVAAYGYDFDYSWSGLLAQGGVAWNVWLTPQLAVYPKLSIGYWYGWWSGWDATYGYGRPAFGGIFLDAAAGAIYRLGRVSLRGELGNGMFRLGTGFDF